MDDRWQRSDPFPVWFDDDQRTAAADRVIKIDGVGSAYDTHERLMVRIDDESAVDKVVSALQEMFGSPTAS